MVRANSNAKPAHENQIKSRDSQYGPWNISSLKRTGSQHTNDEPSPLDKPSTNLRHQDQHARTKEPKQSTQLPHGRGVPITLQPQHFLHQPPSYESVRQEAPSLPEPTHNPNPRDVNTIRNIHVTYGDPGLLTATAAAGALGIAIHPLPRVPVRERVHSLSRLESGRESAAMWRERRSTSQRCYILGTGITLVLVILFAIIYTAV